MRLRRAARLSARALLAHRLRASLALGSVAMGVAGVLMTSAAGKGAQGQIQGEIDAAGANLLVLRPVQVKRSAARRQEKGVVTTLRLDDYRALAALPIVAESAPGIDSAVRAKAG